MEKQRTFCGMKCFCYERVLCWLAIVFAFTIGLIIGTLYSTTITPFITAVIAVAACIAVIISALHIAQCGWRRGA